MIFHNWRNQYRNILTEGISLWLNLESEIHCESTPLNHSSAELFPSDACTHLLYSVPLGSHATCFEHKHSKEVTQHSAMLKLWGMLPSALNHTSLPIHITTFRNLFALPLLHVNNSWKHSNLFWSGPTPLCLPTPNWDQGYNYFVHIFVNEEPWIIHEILNMCHQLSN